MLSRLFIKFRNAFAQLASLSEPAVENERQNFRNLFKQTPEMVCILEGPEHRFEFVNDAHVKALGFDATGLTVRKAQPESVEVHGILDDVYRTGKTAELHEIAVTLTDRLRYFNLTYAARRDLNGKINGVMILGIEVTEDVQARRALKETDDRLRFALEAGNMGTWVVELKDGTVTMSEESCRIMGIEPRGANADQVIQAVIHPEDQRLATEHLQQAIKDLSLYYSEYRIIRPSDQKERWILATGRARVDANGKADIFSGIIMDITNLKQAQIDLRNAKDEAERANDLKSAFLANMSHEIRTPLGAMLGFTDLLKDPALSAAERANYIDILERNGKGLAVIINDILDLSKVEAGHLILNYDAVDAKAITSEVVDLLSLKAKEKHLALSFTVEDSLPKSLISDGIRIKQVLLNLIGNAIKFTHVGSVTVRVFGCHSPTGAISACFEVSDTGIGIPRSQIDQIFEMFVQADGTMTRRFGGTGLGLSLSKSLARELGGDVVIKQTEEGKGSVFLFTVENQPQKLAINQEPKHDQSAIDSSHSLHLDGTRVLVVDDSIDNQHLIWNYLKRSGAIVEFADNGLSGMNKALQGNFDIVLMDVQMPEMDGYTATRELRSAGYKKPIIALTAHAMNETRQKSIELGCTDHLSKPINSKALIATIAAHSR